MTESRELPARMTAWFTTGGGIDDLTPREVDVPGLGEHDVLVRMTARSLNYRDLLVVGGIGGWRPLHPVVPVSDGVGHVVARGGTVTRVDVGDRVSPIFLPRWLAGPLRREDYVDPVGGPANRGVLADYVAVHEDQLVRTPESLTDPEAATLPVAAVTAWHALARASVGTGDTVLVHGTGGVALFALQFARALGARVAITSGSDAKLAAARGLGAELTVNRHDVDVVVATADWTDGRGVTHVIETVGGANLNLSLLAVSIGGAISFVGLIAGVAAEINTYDFVTKNVTVHGIETGSREMYEHMAAFVDTHAIRPHIDTVAPIDTVIDQLRRLQRGDTFGKVALV